ncbi:hypothetical protein ACGC1H_003568 [Rhizoctonia solani]
MEAPQNIRHSALKAPPLKKVAYRYPIRAFEDVKPNVSFVTKLWDTVVSLWELEVALHILVVYLFVWILNVIPESFSEVPCRLPVLPQYFPHCTHELGHPRKLVVTPDFIGLTQLQSRFEYVMEGCTRSSLVAVNMKDSEMALRDLRTLVRGSSISSRDMLGQALQRFIEDARIISENLQQLRHHVWGVVGSIVPENYHAIAVLESIFLETTGGSHGGITDLLRSFGRETPLRRRKKVEDLWLQAIRLLDKSVRKLTNEAQTNVDHLRMIEAGLDNIQDMIITEEDNLRSQEQGLRRRWFADEEKSNTHSASFKLLLKAGDDREHALNHVIGVLSELDKISQGLSDLRAVTSTVASPPNISVEANIKSIQNVTERLQYGQTHMTKNVGAYRRGKSSEQPVAINFH